MKLGPLKKIANHKATFWASVALVGPFALPLLWRDSRYSLFWKVVITIGVIALTIALSKLMVDQTNELIENFEKLRSLQ